jgi:hypothetical protein
MKGLQSRGWLSLRRVSHGFAKKALKFNSRYEQTPRSSFSLKFDTYINFNCKLRIIVNCQICASNMTKPRVNQGIFNNPRKQEKNGHSHFE